MSQPKQSEQVTSFWANNATKILRGKTISHVRYQTPEERQDFDWTNRAPTIVFTDGTRLIPIADEELNEARAMIVVSEEKTQIIPSI